MGLVAAGGLNVVVGQAVLARQNISAMGEAISGGITKLGGLRAAAGLAAGATGPAAVIMALKAADDAAKSRPWTTSPRR